ncbi:MFS transporter [Pseudomonas sp. CMR5c]|uniref:MFS transporter n=1 Tax=Pseudomonas sp. CMR5c TaxID=658630 RepID=UPI00069CDFCB|nr:MFS transporter [Pseudomonas sp. CMR5c]AZC18289.1 Permease of the major facilitator superfamily [Pseudomonas sp. CMR5c]
MSSSTATDRYWILFAVCAAGLILPLEYTGPAMALPAIEHALGGGPVALAWVINAFALSFGSSVMLAGTLADRYGRKRIFVLGMAGFTALSLLIGFCREVWLLDLLRGLQGFAAALAMAAGAAALAQAFEGRARTRAFSLLGSAFGLGLASGPVIAGALVQLAGWQSIFLLGAVIGGAVLIFGVPRMQESRDPGAQALDKPGIFTFSTFLVLLTFAIMQIPQDGLGSLRVLGLLVGAALSLGLFIHIELRQRRPMLDLSLFGYRRFIGIQLLPVATAVCFIVLLILLPLRLIGIEGLGPWRAGAMMIALSAPMAVVPFVAGLLVRWCSAASLSCLGLVIAAGGLLWLSQVPVGQPAMALLWPLLVIGIGTGLPWGLMDDLSVSMVPVERAGMATGIFTTMRACAEAICVAAGLALLKDLLAGGLASGLPGYGPSAVAAAATALAMGDGAVLPTLADALSQPLLWQLYSQAFAQLLQVMAAITLVAACCCALALRQPRTLGCPSRS